jgi:NADP-dependent 3-hydroxy acid dehydrogenase YdfG
LLAKLAPAPVKILHRKREVALTQINRIGRRLLDDHREKPCPPADVAELIVTAIKLPPTSCVVQMTVRPQRSPYREAG